MRRGVGGLIVLLMVGQAGWVQAQSRADTYFRVSAPTANVRSQASMQGLVLARVTRGMELPILSTAGDWVRVSLEDVETREGHAEGYVHRSLGTIEVAEPEAVDQPETVPAAPAAARPEPEAPAAAQAPPVDSASPPALQTQPAAAAQHQVSVPVTDGIAWPTDKRFGAGLRLGGFAFGYGASLRYWMSPRLGIQTELSRYSIDFTGLGGSSITEIAPSVMYRFPQGDPDDDVVLMPYIMGGVGFYTTTVDIDFPGLEESDSETDVGYQFGAGAELWFEDVPSLAVSFDLGYYSTAVPFVGAKIGGFAYGIRAHWYF